MTKENINSSVNVFGNFAYMFATRFAAFRFIISNSIPDWKLTNVYIYIIIIIIMVIFKCYFSGELIALS